MIDNKSFYKLSYGLYIVSSFSDNRLNAQIANTVFQVTSDPVRIAVCINKQNLTYEYIEKSNLIGISVLSAETPMEQIGKFGFKSGRDTNKFEGISYKLTKSGVPIVLDNTVSCFELQVEKEIDVSTHTMFICKVLNAEVLNDKDQMTYQYYQDIKHGKVSRTELNHEENRNESAKKNNYGAKYRCTVCGYIYDPSIGDPNSDIPAGTLFENLPDDWICPICGVAKESFEKII